MFSHFSKSERRSPLLLISFLLLFFLFFLCSSLAEAKEGGFWREVKSSFLHLTRQASAFCQEANRAFLKFFRKDVKEAGKEVGQEAVEAGKETRKALKESGKETAKSLKRSAQEIKANLKKTGKETREGSR